jgi:predicted GNAT family N-acyltransferase
VEVRPASGEDEVEEALRLRVRVFCDEQGVPRDAEPDEYDRDALHVVAVEEGGAVVATCRLVFEGRTAKLGRMAVDARRRDRGVGTALLAEAERHAREARAQRITLHAQMAARPFYARGGFIERGEPFVQAGIGHVMMEKVIG